MTTVVGWDIGGAHVKAARIVDGKLCDVRQVACPLWLGTEKLASVINELRDTFGSADLQAATMTGELADAFPNRRSGVREIAATLEAGLGNVVIYAGPIGFVAAGDASAKSAAVASANWHASAAFAAMQLGSGLFVDMGSTTTDIIPFNDGDVRALGYTDAKRLASGELAYTGYTRGFLMSIADHAPFAGTITRLANEHFATTADVYRILGELDEAVDQLPAADGREKTKPASHARLARMIGLDAGSANHEAWFNLASWFAEMQMRQIEDAARLVLSRNEVKRDAPVLGAGTGLPVVRRLAARLNRPFIDFATLFDDDPWAGHCAPAVAVARLGAVYLARALA